MFNVAAISVFLVLVHCCWVVCVENDDRCNKDVCASIVSKCQLLERCNCDRNNNTCTLDCFKCLDYLYMECCSCVSICPATNHTESASSMQSHAEDLSESLPSLFSTLTEEEDHLLRWTTYSFPVHVSFVTTSGNDPKENNFGSGTKVSLKSDGLDEEEDVQTNCTVAWMADCMSLNKCKSSCSSMGASSYRWFHDGCCECVGPNCVDHGVNESKCRMCPVKETGNVVSIISKDNSRSANPPHATSEGNDYEVGPAALEEEISRQENTVKVSDEEKSKTEKEKEAKAQEQSVTVTTTTATTSVGTISKAASASNNSTGNSSKSSIAEGNISSMKEIS